MSIMNKFRKVVPVARYLANRQMHDHSMFTLLMKLPDHMYGGGNSGSEEKMVNFTVEMEDGRLIPATAKPGKMLRDIISELRLEDFGICDGNLACSTCHVIFSEEDFAKLPSEPSEKELDVIDEAPNYTDLSRMACAVKITPEMEGISVKIPRVRLDARHFVKPISD